ncbi:MAG: hypothetical protein AAGJ40_09795 [Planctomycetota bacterium]
MSTNQQKQEVELTQRAFDLPRTRNLFDYIEVYGCDESFRPERKCKPTKVRPGGMAKAEVIAQRLERSEELWHPDDPVVQRPMTDYERLVGFVVEVEE